MNGPATTPPSPPDDDFEFDVLSARIGAAARIFLTHLDTCSDLLAHVRRNQERIRRTPAELDAAKRLAQDTRREIDGLVERVFKRMPAMANEVLESLLPPELLTEHENEGVRHHPPSREDEAALFNFVGRRGLFRQIDEHFSKFMDDPIAIVYVRSRLMQRAQKSPAEVMAESLLPGVVSAFEQFLSALLRAGLFVHPNGLGELPDIPAKVFDELATKDDIHRFRIDQKIRSILGGRPADWLNSVKKWSKIDLMELGADWLSICESIQRRHAIVHNDGRADADYLQNVAPKYKVELAQGQPLICSADYMSEAVENFRVLGLVLAIRWANHFGKLAPLEVFPDLVNDIYKLERNGRWSAAYIVSDTSVGLHTNDQSVDDHLRVNWWLCRQHLGMKSSEMVGEIYEWSPSDPELKAARAALLGDDEALARIVPEVMANQTHTFARRDFADMVIWQDAKERSAAVRAAFSGRPHSVGRGKGQRRPKRKRQK